MVNAFSFVFLYLNYLNGNSLENIEPRTGG